jgi:adenosylmethionine-8-amino-7-oxononanoate aminotransferase
MGRTGTMYAFEQENVAPDIVTVAKGLGAGYQPIAATIASPRVVGAIERGSQKLRHGQTYMGHAIACATALAVVRAIVDEDLLANVRAMGEALAKRLRTAFADHPHVGEIRGRGLMWALELVRDRATKEPFDPGLRLHARVKDEAFRAGLLCYPGGGTADGERGDHVLLAPAYNIEAHHLDELVDRLDVALERALTSIEVKA